MKKVYDGERQVTKPSSPLQSCRLRFVRFTLQSCCFRSKAVAIALHKRNTFKLKQQTKLRYQQNNNMPNFPLGTDHS